MVGRKITIVLALLFCSCLEQMGGEKEIHEKCLEALKGEIDPTHKFLGVERHEFEGHVVEMCCGEVAGEEGVVKYCFEPAISELSPVDYRSVIYWSLKNGENVKVLEGYEKSEKFIWVAYDEEGRLESVVEYYRKEDRVCARLFDSERNFIGDTCE